MLAKGNCFLSILTGAFSATLFSVIFFKGLKKGKVKFLCLLLLYGCFLIINSASTTPIIMMTIITATIPSSTVDVDARPVGGEAVGAGVAAGLLA